MNWFRKMVIGADKVKTKENADKFNNIPDEEITKLYKIAIVSLLNTSKEIVRVSDFDFSPNKWTYRKEVFSLDQKFGASSENIMCPDINNLLNTEIGHSTVIDLKGNSKGLHYIDIPHDIAILILHDRAVHKSIKLRILMASYYEYVGSVKKELEEYSEYNRRKGAESLLSKKVFTETPEFLEMMLMELNTRMK